MKIKLPAYDPPNAQYACVAVGLSPLLVLLAFTLIVSRVIDPDTGFAVFGACTIWVVVEMRNYQRSIDDYNAQYAARHLSWRSSESLEALLEEVAAQSPTRVFVERFLLAGRVVLRDGQLP